jgi:hypothetical protein
MEKVSAKVVISHIPLKQVFKLISDLLKSIKGGIDEDERAQLLEDLAQIALAIAQDVAK